MIRGKVNKESLSIRNNVTLQPYVDLKIRQNGKIIIGDNVHLDFGTRIVVAENYKVILSDGVRIGHSSIINAGHNVFIGENVAIAGHSLLQASEHILKKDSSIVVGGEYSRGEIFIGDTSWIASHVIIRPSTKIGKNCIIGAHSLVKGDFGDGVKIAGVPAKEFGRIT